MLISKQTLKTWCSYNCAILTMYVGKPFKDLRIVAKYAYVFRNTSRILFVSLVLFNWIWHFIFETYEVQATNIENHSIISLAMGVPAIHFVLHLWNHAKIFSLSFRIRWKYNKILDIIVPNVTYTKTGYKATLKFKRKIILI